MLQASTFSIFQNASIGNGTIKNIYGGSDVIVGQL